MKSALTAMQTLNQAFAARESKLLAQIDGLESTLKQERAEQHHALSITTEQRDRTAVLFDDVQARLQTDLIGLRDALAAREDAISRLGVEISGNDSELEKSQVEVVRLESEKLTLMTRLYDAEAGISDRDRALALNEAQLQSVTCQLTEEMTELDRLREALDQRLADANSLRSLATDQEQALRRVESIGEQLREALLAQVELNRQKDDSIGLLQQSLAARDSELEEEMFSLRAMLGGSQAALLDRERAFSILSEELRAGVSALADRVAEVESLRLQSEDLRRALHRERDDSAQTINSLVTDRELTIRALELAEDQRQEANQAQIQLTVQKDDFLAALQRSLSVKETEKNEAIARLSEELRCSQAKLMEVGENVNRFSLECAALKVEISVATQALFDRSQTVSRLEEQFRTSAAAVTHLSGLVDSLNAKDTALAQLGQSAELREREIACTRQHAARLSAELVAIKSSRLWRFQSSLRRIGGGSVRGLEMPPKFELELQPSAGVLADDSVLTEGKSMLFNDTVGPRSGGFQAENSLTTLLIKQDVEFIEAAYLSLLRRAADPQGRVYYLSRLRAGAPKMQLLVELSRSPEARAMGTELAGLREASRRIRWSQWPLLGRVVRTFVGLESTSETQARLRAIEQQIARMAGADSDCLDRIIHSVSGLAEQVASLKSLPETKGGGVASSPLRWSTAKPPVFFTICSKNFTAYAKTLFDSIVAHHPSAEFYLFLCDAPDPDRYDTSSLPFRVVTLSQLNIPDVEGMALRYNITEFNTAIKPFAFLYLFNTRDATQVVYVDPDIYVTSAFREVIGGFEEGADCILTPHILNPAERAEVSDDKMLLFGIYNLGFVALRNTPRVIQIMEWWGRRLEHECVIALEKGLFVDQKWADLFPAFIPNTLVLRHAGYNVAYWNVPQRSVTRMSGVWFANDEPLRFAHFSGNKLDDPTVYSRHSWTLNTENIGELKSLLEEYREAVFANGHAEYSRLPYAYNWSGAGGVNLHTPEPTKEAAEEVASLPMMASGDVERSNGAVDWKFHQRERAGVPIPRVFVTDWSTPRPDQDAGSVTTFFLLKILVCLGYDVTFAPSDLEPLGEYTQAVRALGVRCLDRNDTDTIQSVLITEGANYSAYVGFRAPIMALYLADIRRFAPNAKIVLETVDLHYLRDERSAQATGSEAAAETARRSKDWELGIISGCDVSIVLSSYEQELLKKELPDTDIRTMPLLFLDMMGPSGHSFEERSDILFIGGFRHTPNVDATVWFCNEIWPKVHPRLPGVRFLIIGSHPPESILELAQIEGVDVIGHVKDLDPIFGRIRLSVTPLRYGAGIKGKVATSLGYGVPVVGTALTFEGMELRNDRHVLIADDASSFADAVVRAYTDKALWERLSRDGFERVNALYSESAGRTRVEALMNSLNIKSSDFSFHVFRSQAQYAQHRRDNAAEYDRRHRVELELINRGANSFFVKGYCVSCQKDTEFQVSFMYSYQSTVDGEPIPNWREHLNCMSCGHTNRVRLMLHLIQSYIRPLPQARVYISEQTTTLFAHLAAQYEFLTGSEYLGTTVPFGEEHNGWRNEDMTRLTFDSRSFDLMISCDVLEHVSDDLAAFSECYRCLAPGGRLLFTAPCSLSSDHNIVRARLAADGSIEHLINPPEYHGNPVDPENGALCFRYFGWEILQQLRSVGFVDAYAISAWSRSFGYLGGEQIVFVAIKGAV